jgi:multisubunit Na+/H+ antiporter MnhG subunit
MVVVPAAIPVTTPVEALTVATAALLEDQVPPEVVDEKVDAPPIKMFCSPESVPTVGGAETVTVLVAVALAQPPEPVTVYVIVVVPAAIPVTKPVALTVATAVLDEDHVLTEDSLDDQLEAVPESAKLVNAASYPFPEASVAEVIPVLTAPGTP